jgi:hypothetical protein
MILENLEDSIGFCTDFCQEYYLYFQGIVGNFRLFNSYVAFIQSEEEVVKYQQSVFISILSLSSNLLIMSSPVFANCIEAEQGRVAKFEVQTCEVIAAEKNEEVKKYAGSYERSWNLKKAYTGALIKDSRGSLWMYPTGNKNPCVAFPKKKTVNKRAYSTCCDTGRWGKCVFGGRWLGDLDGKPINAFQ